MISDVTIIKLATRLAPGKTRNLSLASRFDSLIICVHCNSLYWKMAPPPPPPPPPPPLPDELGFEAVLQGLSNGTAEENSVCILNYLIQLFFRHLFSINLVYKYKKLKNVVRNGFNIFNAVDVFSIATALHWRWRCHWHCTGNGIAKPMQILPNNMPLALSMQCCG